MAEVAPAGAPAASVIAGAPKRSPSEFLKSVIGRPVLVRLNTGADYKGERDGVLLCARTLGVAHWSPVPTRSAGILVCLDGFMNIALEQSEEWSEGVLRHKLGDVFLRGNNGAPRRTPGFPLLTLCS
jgi:U6 snRNA-associated Sm-like protein LSm6